MPRPDIVPPLPPGLDLPPLVRRVVELHLHHALTSSDHLLILADHLDEAAATVDIAPALACTVHDLANELRRRAPEYA